MPKNQQIQPWMNETINNQTRQDETNKQTNKDHTELSGRDYKVIS